MKNSDLRILVTFFEGGKSVAVIHNRENSKSGGDINARTGRPFHHFIGLRITAAGMQGYSCTVHPPGSTL